MIPLPYQVSLWLFIQALLDPEELEALFAEMGSFFIFITGKATKRGEGEIKKEDFFLEYRNYIKALLNDSLGNPSSLFPFFYISNYSL